MSVPLKEKHKNVNKLLKNNLKLSPLEFQPSLSSSSAPIFIDLVVVKTKYVLTFNNEQLSYRLENSIVNGMKPIFVLHTFHSYYCDKCAFQHKWMPIKLINYAIKTCDQEYL